MDTSANLRDVVDATLACAQRAAANKLHDEAIGLCREVLALDAEHPAALALLATLLGQRGETAEAIALMEQAIGHDQTQPTWYANLCAIYRNAHRPNEALRAAFAAVALDSMRPPFLVNLALSYLDMDHREEAVACLLRAIAIDQEDAPAHLVLSHVLLASGEMQAGWLEYEWRVRIDGQGSAHVRSACWNGMQLKRGAVLLIADQGFGDSIQFSRYIPMVAERCAEVYLSCSRELAPILSGIPGLSHCYVDLKEIPKHAAHCRLSSLPWLFQTRLETIPEQSYLSADPARVERWQGVLDERVGWNRKRIGLAWRGSKDNINDARRSLRLEQLLPLAAARRDEDAVFVSLQKPVNEADRATWPQFGELVDFSEALGDFGETAALVSNLDLVICVDTAVAHLSAALGKPTWVLIGKAADWRWFFDRTDSPWYPTMRLFRQEVSGEWDLPIQKLASALRSNLLGEAREVPSPAGSAA